MLRYRIFKNRKNESSKQKELLSQDPTCDGRELGEGKDRGKDRRGGSPLGNHKGFLGPGMIGTKREGQAGVLGAPGLMAPAFCPR